MFVLLTPPNHKAKRKSEAKWSEIKQNETDVDYQIIARRWAAEKEKDVRTRGDEETKKRTSDNEAKSNEMKQNKKLIQKILGLEQPTN